MAVVSAVLCFSEFLSRINVKATLCLASSRSGVAQGGGALFAGRDPLRVLLKWQRRSPS